METVKRAQDISHEQACLVPVDVGLDSGKAERAEWQDFFDETCKKRARFYGSGSQVVTLLARHGCTLAMSSFRLSSLAIASH